MNLTKLHVFPLVATDSHASAGGPEYRIHADIEPLGFLENVMIHTFGRTLFFFWLNLQSKVFAAFSVLHLSQTDTGALTLPRSCVSSVQTRR
jgi:hypothetical protein